MATTVEDIRNALTHVMDPDLKRDLVTLNMIDDIRVEGNRVSFKIILTTPACPLKNKIKQDAEEAVRKYAGKDLDIDIEMTSRVTTRRKDEEEMLKGVKNIVAVASGKGGVGKSTIAVNLAVALAQSGASVGLVDADIYGPSIPMMFGVAGQMPDSVEVDGNPRILPIKKFGVKLLSIGFFVDPRQAVVWRGPMASNALKQLFSEAEWGELDYMVIDLPPGTGDIHLTLVQSLPVTGAVIVTTPQEIALADARKAVNMFAQEKIKVPVLGLVENMSYFTPAELPDNRYYIFGKEGGKRLAEQEEIPLLGEIPIVQGIQESGDSGEPAVLNSASPVAKAFTKMSEAVAQQIAIRNAHLPPTQKVEMNK